MIAAMSLVSVVLGAAVAYAAERYPAHIEALETGAGCAAASAGALPLLGSGLPSHASETILKF